MLVAVNSMIREDLQRERILKGELELIQCRQYNSNLKCNSHHTRSLEGAGNETQKKGCLWGALFDVFL